MLLWYFMWLQAERYDCRHLILFSSFPLIVSTLYATRPITWARIYCLWMWLVKAEQWNINRGGISLNNVIRNKVLRKTDIWISWRPAEILCLCIVCFIIEKALTRLRRWRSWLTSRREMHGVYLHSLYTCLLVYYYLDTLNIKLCPPFCYWRHVEQ